MTSNEGQLLSVIAGYQGKRGKPDRSNVNCRRPGFYRLAPRGHDLDLHEGSLLRMELRAGPDLVSPSGPAPISVYVPFGTLVDSSIPGLQGRLWALSLSPSESFSATLLLSGREMCFCASFRAEIVVRLHRIDEDADALPSEYRIALSADHPGFFVRPVAVDLSHRTGLIRATSLMHPMRQIDLVVGGADREKIIVHRDGLNTWQLETTDPPSAPDVDLFLVDWPAGYCELLTTKEQER